MDGENSPNGSTTAGGSSDAKDEAASPFDGEKSNEETSALSVVACRQCRSRKVRCDSARPVCKNCARRSDPCEYDTAPKRRGPDRQPGTRQRLYKKKPEDASIPYTKPAKPSTSTTSPHELQGPHRTVRTRTTEMIRKTSSSSLKKKLPSVATGTPTKVSSELQVSLPHTLGDRDLEASLRAVGFESIDRLLRIANHEIISASSNMWTTIPKDQHLHEPPVLVLAGRHASQNSLLYAADEDIFDDIRSDFFIPRGPSSSFHKQTWFDSLLSIYSDDPSQSMRRVFQDLHLLLENSVYWLSFINFPRFVDNIFNPSTRIFVQPSLVLSALAMATMMKSSEVGLGEEGRRLALWLRDAAQSSLDASICASWIEPSLAQAAFFLALFEASPHPGHSATRISSSVSLLDSIIQALSLTKIDASEPSVTTFLLDDVPRVNVYGLGTEATPLPSNQTRVAKDIEDTDSTQPRCTCGKFPVGPGVNTKAPSKTSSNPSQKQGSTPRTAEGISATSFSPEGSSKFTADWPDVFDVVEIQKEESRRVCWSSMMLFTALREYSPVKLEAATWELHVTKPESFSIFFPGEKVSKVDPKNSVWALHARAALLWNSCQKLSSRPDWNTRRAELAGKAWMEANAIEDGLRAHACPAGHGTPYAGGEYLLQIKLLISNQFTISAPIPQTLGRDSDNAKSWLAHRTRIIRHVRMMGYFVAKFGAAVAALTVSKRPLSVWWAMYQIRSGILLWRANRNLNIALEQSVDLLGIADFMTAMWPSGMQQGYYEQLKTELLECCLQAGIHVPAPVPIPGLPMELNAKMIPSFSMAKEASASDISMAPLD